jgi:hypothetical protein
MADTATGAIRVNGGIFNSQTLAGSLRFFKITGPFAWTISDGTVNLPVSTTGGATPVTSYFQVGATNPVPKSAAELAFRIICEQADVVLIGLVGSNGSTTEIDFAVSATGFGWGSDTPNYTTSPGAEDLTAAAPEMQAAVRLLGSLTVYITAGASAAQTVTPVTATADMTAVAITEVPFQLH